MCRNNLYRKLLLSGLGFGGLLVSPAQADVYHYNNQLISERAAGMGGAYTAVSDDSGGLYYNPAGIVYTQGNKLSASVNTYSETTTRHKNALGAYDWVRSSAGLIPSFFGLVQEFGDGVAGFSYAIVDSTLTDQDQVFYGLSGKYGELREYYINFNESDTSSLMGPSYAIALNEDFSVGLTVYYFERNAEWVIREFGIYEPNGEYFFRNIYFEAHEYGVQPTVGLMWDVSEKWSLGFSMGKKMKVADTASFHFAQYDEYLAKNDPLSDQVKAYQYIGSGSAASSYPFFWRAGLAYFPDSRNLFSADFSYYSSSSNAAVTWNAALGMESYLSKDLAWRMGVYTNNANTRVPVAGQTGQLPHIDMLGGAISLTHFSRYSSLTAGLIYSRGEGLSQVGGTTALEVAERTSMTIFVSAGTNY